MTPQKASGPGAFDAHEARLGDQLGRQIITTAKTSGPKLQARRSRRTVISRRILILRECDDYGTAWLVLAPNGHGWLHGEYADALRDAEWMADNLNVGITNLSGGHLRVVKQSRESVS